MHTELIQYTQKNFSRFEFIYKNFNFFDKTFVAFFILYKFHGTLIEMNLNTHIFSQKKK